MWRVGAAMGTLECLGRTDHQVKVRGFRIELGEIEHALVDHPDLTEAAVVVRETNSGDGRLIAFYVANQRRAVAEGELRGLIQRTLPPYMMPSAFIELAQLPRTPNGKTDRDALPQDVHAGADDHRPRRAPSDDVQRRLFAIWSELLGFTSFGVNDSFFDLGGHSLLAVQLINRIEQEFDRQLPLITLFRQSTIEQLAERLRDRESASVSSSLVPIQTSGEANPLFCVHPAGGTVFCYLALAKHLGPNQPVYGLQARGLDGDQPPHDSVSEMAAFYVELIRSVKSTGPYRLCGWSYGGIVAFEMARQLRDAGQYVESLTVLDTVIWPPDRTMTEDDVLGMLVEMLPGSDQLPLEQIRGFDSEEQAEYFRDRAERARLVTPWSQETRFHSVFEVFQGNLQSMFRYRPQPYDGPLLLLRAEEHSTPAFQDPNLGWNHWATGWFDVHNVPCEHLEMFREPWVRQVASLLSQQFQRAAAATPPPLDTLGGLYVASIYHRLTRCHPTISRTTWASPAYTRPGATREQFSAAPTRTMSSSRGRGRPISLNRPSSICLRIPRVPIHSFVAFSGEPRRFAIVYLKDEVLR